MKTTHNVICECGSLTYKHGKRKNKVVPIVHRYKCQSCGATFSMLNEKKVSFFGKKRSGYVESRRANRDVQREVDCGEVQSNGRLGV